MKRGPKTEDGRPKFATSHALIPLEASSFMDSDLIYRYAAAPGPVHHKNHVHHIILKITVHTMKRGPMAKVYNISCI
jgi:hypothetical protein